MIQGELEALAIEVESLYSQLEIRILNDIVERIRINGFSTATADWKITGLENIFSDVVYKEYYGSGSAVQGGRYNRISTSRLQQS